MRVVLVTAYLLFSIGCSIEQPAEVSSHAEAMSDESETAVLALIEALEDEEWIVRLNAAHALGKIRSDAQAGVPVLIEALKDEKSGVRWNAAFALGEFGPDAMPAVPALLEASKNEEEMLRKLAASAPDPYQEERLRKHVAWTLESIGLK